MKVFIPYYLLMIQGNNEMFDNVIHDFQQKLNARVLTEPDLMQRAKIGIEISDYTLTQLKDLVEKEDFENIPEEITFFKKVKPYPMSYLIFYSEVRSCENRKPKAGKNFQFQFFEKELRKINKFFSKNTDFVVYMEQDHTYLDHQLFTRNHRNNFPYTPMVNYYQYPEFSSSHDMLWAKVQAMYLLIHYIRDAMETLKPGQQEAFSNKQHKLIHWTGSKTALIEIIYALHTSGDLNHGTVEISAIVSSFEDFFNLKLNNFYKTYSEIKSRQEPRTKYLYKLVMSLESKMKKDDEK